MRILQDEPGCHVSPADRFGPLFEAVQTARLFADGKTFADAVPLSPVADIMSEFATIGTGNDILRAFVSRHFALPVPLDVRFAGQGGDLREYIRSVWPVLLRPGTEAEQGSSRLPTPLPHIVPGGRFTELYYWDSYFTMLGLVRDGQEDVARSMLEIFTKQIEDYGHIPNGTRTYYLSRSQPPFYHQMLRLLPMSQPDQKRRHLSAMQAEHAFWMRGAEHTLPGETSLRCVRMPDGALLNRYWDDRDTPRDEAFVEDCHIASLSAASPNDTFRALRAAAESGWDFSSRWFEEGMDLRSIRTQSIIPVDLNAFLYGLECVIADWADELFETGIADAFRAKARRRRTAIGRWLWSPQGYFADFDLVTAKFRGGVTAATFAPLFTGAATQAQAAKTARTAAGVLLASGGLRTTLVETGEQWDAPNGWAPLQWIAFRGLQHYGHRDLAEQIACRWVQTVEAEFLRSGAMHEKYNVETGGRGMGGEYIPQVGFGWTNGVTAAFLDWLVQKAARSETEAKKTDDARR